MSSALSVRSRRHVALVRAAFLAATPVLGLGLIAYLTWWLLLARGGEVPRSGRRPDVSVLAGLVTALGCGVGLLTLGLGSALAVVFGLGWGVLVVAGALLATGLVFLRAAHPGLVLLPLVALVLPAGVLLAAGEQLPRSFASRTVTPSRALPARTLSTSTATLLVDLRRFSFHAGTDSTLHVDGGIGRTIVALPIDRCVAVRVHYDVRLGLLHAAAEAGGLAADGDDPALSVFGVAGPAGGSGELTRWAAPHRPVLAIDYRSEGGALYVRDYPDGLDPADFDDWPGAVTPDPRPVRGGLSRVQFATALGDWRAIRRENRRVARLAPGPCRNAR